MKSKQLHIIFRFLEVIAWILFCALPIFFLKKPSHGDEHPIFHSSLNFIFIFLIKNIKFIILFYVHALILIPHFFANKKYSQYIFYVTILFLVVASIPFISEYFLHFGSNQHHLEINSFHDQHEQHEHEEHHGHRGKMPMMDMGMHFFMTIIILILPFLLYVYRSWVSSEKEKAEIELSFLKSQINHHFLFNSLNSIYSLSVQESKETPEAVHSLSYIMRYVLDETVKDKSLLRKELEYIHHYLSLQRVRLNEKIKLTYTEKGDANNKLISPMILIPFIENCFKHGVSTIHDCTINISIEIQNTQLTLKTDNEIIPTSNIKDVVSGIGIPNVIKRLEHDYFGKFIYKKNIVGNKYFVELKLELI
jgi:sensor histidine kinase YesM